MANIKIGDNLRIGKKTPNIDARYGPWESKLDCINHIGPDNWDVIKEGLTVGIIVNGIVEEYWFQGGTDIEHLIPKGAHIDAVTSIREYKASQDGGDFASDTTFPTEKAVAKAIADVNQYISDTEETLDGVAKKIGDITPFKNDPDYQPDPSNPNVADILTGLKNYITELYTHVGEKTEGLDDEYPNNNLYQIVDAVNAYLKSIGLDIHAIQTGIDDIKRGNDGAAGIALVDTEGKLLLKCMPELGDLKIYWDTDEAEFQPGNKESFVESNKDLPSIDTRYGPYLSKNAAVSILNQKDLICNGLTVGVVEGNKIVEYWFQSLESGWKQNGVNPIDYLVAKQGGIIVWGIL